jgi:hypothetical protein
VTPEQKDSPWALLALALTAMAGVIVGGIAWFWILFLR